MLIASNQAAAGWRSKIGQEFCQGNLRAFSKLGDIYLCLGFRHLLCMVKILKKWIQDELHLFTEMKDETHAFGELQKQLWNNT